MTFPTIMFICSFFRLRRSVFISSLKAALVCFSRTITILTFVCSLGSASLSRLKTWLTFHWLCFSFGVIQFAIVHVLAVMVPLAKIVMHFDTFFFLTSLFWIFFKLSVFMANWRVIILTNVPLIIFVFSCHSILAFS